MKYNLTIALIGMVAILLLLSGIANAQAVMTKEAGEYKGAVMKGTMDEGTAKFECDPCDYNVDSGNTGPVGEEGAVREGAVKIDCDPCDYNIDYGRTDRSTQH